jgi:hypothetical protein
MAVALSTYEYSARVGSVATLTADLKEVEKGHPFTACSALKNFENAVKIVDPDFRSYQELARTVISGWSRPVATAEGEKVEDASVAAKRAILEALKAKTLTQVNLTAAAGRVSRTVGHEATAWVPLPRTVQPVIDAQVWYRNKW